MRAFHGPWLAVGIAVALVAAIGAAIVVPGLRPGEYSFLERRSDGTPVGWDPCRTIHYETNLQGAPANELDDVQGAIARVSAATGIPFAYDGPTKALPFGVDGAPRVVTPPGEEAPPLLIAWLDEKEFEDVGGNDSLVGLALPVAEPDGLHYDTGFVALNGSQHLLPGFGIGPTWGPVILHELGHIMGLGHVPDANELMFAQENPVVNGFGKGDLAGLRILGRHGTCPAGVAP